MRGILVICSAVIVGLVALVLWGPTIQTAGTIPSLIQAERVEGPARVIDGDSIEINGERIRLAGIDAPEIGQPCHLLGGVPFFPGNDAKRSLYRMSAGANVLCRRETVDRYGRTIATCYVDGENINEKMVAEGWAVGYARFDSRYKQAQADAKAARLGIWRGQCDWSPEQWRKWEAEGR